MRARVPLSLVFAIPAAFCFGLAGVACTDGTTPNCSGDAAASCDQGVGEASAESDTGSSADTGSGQESGTGAETGADATETGADAGKGQDASMADGDASHPQDARGQ